MRVRKLKRATAVRRVIIVELPSQNRAHSSQINVRECAAAVCAIVCVCVFKTHNHCECTLSSWEFVKFFRFVFHFQFGRTFRMNLVYFHVCMCVCVKVRVYFSSECVCALTSTRVATMCRVLDYLCERERTSVFEFVVIEKPGT